MTSSSSEATWRRAEAELASESVSSARELVGEMFESSSLVSCGKQERPGRPDEVQSGQWRLWMRRRRREEWGCGKAEGRSSP